MANLRQAAKEALRGKRSGLAGARFFGVVKVDLPALRGELSPGRYPSTLRFGGWRESSHGLLAFPVLEDAADHRLERRPRSPYCLTAPTARDKTPGAFLTSTHKTVSRTFARHPRGQVV